MSETEKTVEEVVEAVVNRGISEEGVAVITEATRAVRQMTATHVAFGAACGFAAGAAIGFRIAYKRAELKFQKISDEEISQMKEHYRAKKQAAEEQVKEDLGEVVTDLGYKPASPEAHKAQLDQIRNEPTRTVVVEPVEPTVVVQNVFDGNLRGLSTDVWDYNKELAARTPDHPYVIHKEEFAEGVLGEEYENATVTYYLEDDVVANERDQRLDDIDAMLGLENLEKFGHGSEDANVVYIRNNGIKVDFEVLRSAGSYTAEVLGQDPEPPEDELQHSDMRRRTPRFDDA